MPAPKEVFRTCKTISTALRFTLSKLEFLVSGLMYYICHGPPDAEVVFRSNLETGIIGIGRDKPAFPVLFNEVLQGKLAVQFAHGYLLRRRIAVTFIDYDNVAADDTGIYH